MPALGRFFAFLDKYLVGYALGTAAGPSLEPYVQHLANLGWEANQIKPLDAFLMAQVAVENPNADGAARAWAARAGVDSGRFDQLKEVADDPPDVETLLRLWRRGLISSGAFGTGLQHLRIEAEYHGPLAGLREVLLSPAELANARQQGFIQPQQQIDQAGLQGVPPGRAEIQYELAGLPPGAMDSLQLLRRGIVDDATYRQIVREGHTKTKYTDALLALRDHILTAREWASLWLRGWVTEAEAKAGGALDGYGPAEMELLYKNRGRPATTRQVHIGYARGGTLPGAANEREAFETAVRNSNVRTEYVDLLWAQRHTYPSAFVIRALTQAGTFDGPTAERILIESGWPPQYAALAATDWAGAAGAGPGTKWADRARTRVFTEAWGDYLDGNADEPELRSLLQAVGATGAEQDTIVTLATTIRGRTRRDLTQAQILKLFKKAIWARDQAQVALEDLGMDAGDASDLLDSV